MGHLIEVLNNAVFKFVPRRKRRIRKKQIWRTRGIEQARKLRQIFLNIHNDRKNSYAYYDYEMALNNATKAICSEKISLKKMACNIKNDPKAFYRYARKKMQTKDSVGPLINDNGDAIRVSRCVAHMLSKYFASVFFQQKFLIIFPLSILQPIVT